MLKTMLFVDNSGLIVSYGNDGGDSCCRNYTFHLRNAILKQLGLPQSTSTSIVADSLRTANLLEIDSGYYVRNPNPNVITKEPMWYNDPRNVSRDQLTPVLCYNAYMAFHGENAGMSAYGRLEAACIKRLGFAQNYRNADRNLKIPDPMTPDLWAVGLRSYGYWFAPVVAVLDSFILLSTVIKLWAPKVISNPLIIRWQDPTDTDDENMNNVLMATQYTYDTPFSWLARKLYKRFRKPNIGNTQYGETNPIMGALVAYSNANCDPELAEMARPIVEKY